MNISLVFCKLMRAVFIENWDEIKVNQIVEPYQVSLKMRRLFVISGGHKTKETNTDFENVWRMISLLIVISYKCSLY